MNASQFNALHEVGVPVFAYPGCRPEDGPDERLVTRTRSKAEVLGGHTDVVWVDGHSACIALGHVDVVSEDVWEEARTADAVRVLGALPMPVLSERDRLKAAFIEALKNAARTHPCPVLGDQTWSGCVHYDEAGHVSGVGSCHSERRADAVLAVRDAEVEFLLGEADRLTARVAELEAERHTTNEALSDAAEALRENQHRIAELERPALERHRREVRERYHWLAESAFEAEDFEGERVVWQQLAEREAVWVREDELAKEFAADPLAVKPWTPGPSVEASADKLTRLLAPTQALREGEHYAATHHTYLTPRDFPESGGAK